MATNLRQSSEKTQTREERVAESLRENLRKRKEQKTARASETVSENGGVGAVKDK
ncbi:MAG: hypothetical protein PHE27_03615 [Alphaproteobacteria bacterium]|nr:hypothetical protein [Alphaproteobacteria bacterium]